MDEMFEETNRQDEDLDDLFSEEPETRAESESEPAVPESGEAEAAPTGETSPAEPAPATVKVKHLGQEMELSMEELIANAQKGLDYDHIRTERDNLKPEIELLDQLAKAAGMSRGDYVAAVRKHQEDAQIAAQMQRGIPEDVARRLQALEGAQRQREAEDQARAAAQARNRDLAAFVKAYPDVTEFPEEVVAAIAQGEKPLAAYQAYENKQLKAKLAAYQKNEENKQKTAGSMKGSGASEEADAFSSGFDSAF